MDPGPDLGPHLIRIDLYAGSGSGSETLSRRMLRVEKLICCHLPESSCCDHDNFWSIDAFFRLF
jgi:hypothetical protein